MNANFFFFLLLLAASGLAPSTSAYAGGGYVPESYAQSSYEPQMKPGAYDPAVKPLRERLEEARSKALYPMRKDSPSGYLYADGMDYSRYEEGTGPGQWRDW